MDKVTDNVFDAYLENRLHLHSKKINETTSFIALADGKDPATFGFCAVPTRDVEGMLSDEHTYGQFTVQQLFRRVGAICNWLAETTENLGKKNRAYKRG